MNDALPATNRFQIRPAPDDLLLAQDILNTRGIAAHDMPDLLDDPISAQAWLDAVLGSPTTTLTAHDLRRLREFRAALVKAITDPVSGTTSDGGTAAISVPARIELDDAGQVRIMPEAAGWRSVAALTLAGIARAQQAGTWNRLKLCGNPACLSAFYDTSKNNSGVWHDVHTCGNRMNLRAARARKRAARDTTPEQSLG